MSPLGVSSSQGVDLWNIFNKKGVNSRSRGALSGEILGRSAKGMEIWSQKSP